MPRSPACTTRTALQLVGCLLLAATHGALAAQGNDVLRIVNQIRAPGGACNANAPALLAHAALDDAASRIARGEALAAATQAAGYRMVQAQVITVTGAGSRAALQTLLAGRFCPQIGKKELTQIGVYETRKQIWIVLAAPFAPKVDLTREQTATRMLALVNQARSEPRRCGDKSFAAAGALSWDETLETAAAAHARDMAGKDYFSHTSPDGSTPAQRVSRAGYRYRMTGENIAAGQLSPETAMAGWLKSPGHCANLMQPGYTEIGVAFAVNPTSKMGAYWVQLFGTPR